MSDGTKSNQTMPNDTESNQTMSDPAKSSTWRRRFKKPIKCTLAFLSKFLCDWSLSFAAMLAYYLLVAIVPTAVAVFGIIGLIIRHDPKAQLKLINQLVFAASGGNHSKGPTDQVIIYSNIKEKKVLSPIFVLGSKYGYGPISQRGWFTFCYGYYCCHIWRISTFCCY